jgi:5-formyltetrahydrofolate cyclo-ligase
MERLEKSQEIGESFFNNFNLEKIKTLHIFLSIERLNEIETKFIYEKIWRDFPKIKTVVPRINSATQQLESHEFHSGTKLSPNNWQIAEPEGENLVKPTEIDLVVVPLLCFDKKGFRVGYGKGFYDKFLANCRKDCLKIGLSYFSSIEEISDTNKYDVTLDYCLTPEKIYTF